MIWIIGIISACVGAICLIVQGAKIRRLLASKSALESDLQEAGMNLYLCRGIIRRLSDDRMVSILEGDGVFDQAAVFTQPRYMDELVRKHLQNERFRNRMEEWPT